ncbi:hypothetical protein [Paenibacillus sp. L3-i20]|uniref:hypothetical protein n=1 Tax=Paenibacillus sp. L3-i20 TaxID=2905833 RepID=UPI001EDFD6F3|nr:hypothetical protein [Paenibacillus sp. L3-i20]GKU79320.1 hypothetical protein L3i20_v237170 [Paenibacillus sp. L3-i20]
MNRQKVREFERKGAAFESRKAFAPNEVVAMNNASYALGVEHALEAVAIVYGLGDKRVERVREKLRTLQELDFNHSPEAKAAHEMNNMYKVKLNRAIRRANDPKRKGAFIDDN